MKLFSIKINGLYYHDNITEELGNVRSFHQEPHSEYITTGIILKPDKKTFVTVELNNRIYAIAQMIRQGKLDAKEIIIEVEG